jgi:hypothetical protein
MVRIPVVGLAMSAFRTGNDRIGKGRPSRLRAGMTGFDPFQTSATFLRLQFPHAPETSCKACHVSGRGIVAAVDPCAGARAGGRHPGDGAITPSLLRDGSGTREDCQTLHSRKRRSDLLGYSVREEFLARIAR